MLKSFICPDGDIREVADCLKGCPRGERCLTLPTLHSVAWERPWTGNPSTTELINGTRYMYLKLTKDYAIDPRDRAFSLLGTRHHYKLHSIVQKLKLNALTEEQLGEEVKGTLDLLEPDDSAETEAYILTDYKTWGSWKVAKALGLVGHKVPDPSGAVYQRNGEGYKKGDPKMITQWKQDPQAVDMWEAELQLNNYRLLLEECGFPISQMRIQATVRDGGTFIAENRGLTEKIYLIPVKWQDNGTVRAYFIMKRGLLLEHLKGNTMPPPCTAKENWDGARCESFCEVWEYCDVGIQKHKEGGK